MNEAGRGVQNLLQPCLQNAKGEKRTGLSTLGNLSHYVVAQRFCRIVGNQSITNW